MRFDALRLQTAHLEVQRTFYTKTRGLPLVVEDATAFTVQAGATHLTFAASAGFANVYHVAFNVPRGAFHTARKWIAARVPLLREGERDTFASTGGWNAEMVYFRDAAGNILEFIARGALPDDASGAFGPEMIRCVSEIGLPVSAVSAQSAALALAASLSTAPYDEQSDTFAPVGDEHGLIIVVREGRPWFPTHTAAMDAPLHLTVRGNVAGAYRVPGTAFSVTVVPPAQ